MGEEITTEFDHPEPDQNRKLKFCQYWKESWMFHSGQLISNPLHVAQVPSPVAISTPSAFATPVEPVSATPAIPKRSAAATPVPSVPVHSPSPIAAPDGLTKRTPLQWLASQYPYRDIKNGGGEAWLDEMPLLERRMNTENKEPVSLIT